MTPLAWGFLIAIGLIAVLAVLMVMYFKEKTKEEKKKDAITEVRWPKSIFEDDTPVLPIRPKSADKPVGLGAPIFGAGSKKKPITTLHDDEVWCLTPLGIMSGTVTNNVIDCGKYEITPKFVPDYFSQEMATKLGIPTAVWIVDDIRDPLKMIGYKFGKKSGITPISDIKMVGARWIRDNSFFCDFLDIMIEELWFEFIFDGFDRPLEWYEGLEPLFEDGERTGGLETFLEAAPLCNMPTEGDTPLADIEVSIDCAPIKQYEPPKTPPSYGVDDGDNSYDSGGDYGGGDD